MNNQEDKSTIFGIFHRSALPEGATPVAHFELEKYFGRWYEIARLNYYWEDKDLTNVYATYSANDDGTVKVVNTGYDEENQKWKTFEGKAKFRGDNTLAALDVSFFGPIWAGYNVVSVDDDYKYALVFGRNLDYIWILSRDISIAEHVKEKYLKIAEHIGYDISKLNWIDQSKH